MAISSTSSSGIASDMALMSKLRRAARHFSLK